MIRNFKVLGLALVAVLALSAAIASAASASVFTSDGPATLTGTELPVEGEPAVENYLEAFGLKTKCPGTVVTGHKYNVTPHELIPSGATTLTLNLDLGTPCTTAGLPTTVDLNGCDFVAHIGAAGALTGDQVCPEGKDITVTVFFNATDHANNVPFCVLHISAAENQGLGGTAKLANGTGGTDIEASGAFEGIDVVSTDLGTHTLLCPGPSGGSETSKKGKLAIHSTLSGKNSGGTSTSVSIS